MVQSLQSKRIIGIDYGKKRIGVAISDEAGTIAFPHDVIINTPEALSQILDLARANGADTFVVGESKDFKGKDNTIMKSALIFCEELKKKDFKVFLEPEIYSTLQAERIQGKRDNIDASAAAVILQSYLDWKGDPYEQV